MQKRCDIRLANLQRHGAEKLCLKTPPGYLPLESANRIFATRWATDMKSLLVSGDFFLLWQWYRSGELRPLDGVEAECIPVEAAVYAPLYRHPPKIWGIGLNYADHATDLSEKAPTGIPASFMKPDTALIGPGEPIPIPLQSHRTTAEAELGIVIGRRCKSVPESEWQAVVAGYTPVIDMTAEDILRQNPRYLTLSKSFDGFFSFGPELATPDEVADLPALSVETVINGRVHARNTVAKMTFPPGFLVSFHSAVMTLLPGDVISTGTPGAAVISDGDLVTCRIDGFTALTHPVIDLKRT